MFKTEQMLLMLFNSFLYIYIYFVAVLVFLCGYGTHNVICVHLNSADVTKTRENRLVRTWSFEFVLSVMTKRTRNMKRRNLVKMEKLFWSAETKFIARGASLGQRPLLLHLWVSKISLSA